LAACRRAPKRVVGCCPVPHHFHLLLSRHPTPIADLPAGRQVADYGLRVTNLPAGRQVTGYE